jgi:hypothetical protein
MMMKSDDELLGTHLQLLESYGKKLASGYGPIARKSEPQRVKINNIVMELQRRGHHHGHIRIIPREKYGL